MDPLAQLHDIQTPAPISDLPTAIGWWILLALSLLSIVLLIRYFIRRKQVRQHQKQALRALAQATSDQEIIEVLKWAAMGYFPRAQVASLHSSALQLFLSQQLNTKKQAKFNALCQSQFDLLYQRADENQAPKLEDAAKYWVMNALPTSGGQHV